jgi:FMN phosphatase YigB (HAD superfamily)
MREIAKAFKRKRKKVIADFTEFYANDYNELERHVRPAKNAIETVELCFNKGYNIIVATTPIFTKTAIMKRLEWSGMGNFDFQLVTHAENMHFSKPRDEYYTEIMKKIKTRPENSIMVGNEFLGDVVGPSRIGIYTFYCPVDAKNDTLFISPELEKFSKIKPTFIGELSDFIDLVNNDFQEID